VARNTSLPVEVLGVASQIPVTFYVGTLSAETEVPVARVRHVPFKLEEVSLWVGTTLQPDVTDYWQVTVELRARKAPHIITGLSLYSTRGQGLIAGVWAPIMAIGKMVRDGTVVVRFKPGGTPPDLVGVSLATMLEAS
jgi:hypothetical protein